MPPQKPTGDTLSVFWYKSDIKTCLYYTGNVSDIIQQQKQLLLLYRFALCYWICLAYYGDQKATVS